MPRELLVALAGQIGEQLVTELLNADQSSEAGIRDQRNRVAALKEILKGVKDSECYPPAQYCRRACPQERLDHRW